MAIKVLPEEFVNDPDRVARFKREAQVLASFNHPNIAQIYEFEDTGPIKFLVMELVVGLSAGSCARYTSPMPPMPISATIS